MEETAQALARARREATALDAFPGPLPADLTQAYAIQQRVLAAAGPAGGWKVAMIPPPVRSQFKVDRIAGPILTSTIQRSESAKADFVASVYEGGFSALEAEFAFVMGRDLNPADAPYDDATIAASVASLHAAVEIASSPISSMFTLGPLAMVGDFGGNAGAIVGPAFADWREGPLERLVSRTSVDGVVVGEGSAAKVPGGPLAALSYLAHHLAALGVGLAVGDVVLTGMTTGVHPVKPGSRAVVEFPGVAEIRIDVQAIAGRR
ncbi:MAG: 2-keto-4-pentenoate hydratase [Rhodopseudomonas sp.]|nr:2-keto-4-pentenoate hydratase [Rhodopseudomonas sp.]